jgi:hypothetical protein
VLCTAGKGHGVVYGRGRHAVLRIQEPLFGDAGTLCVPEKISLNIRLLRSIKKYVVFFYIFFRKFTDTITEEYTGQGVRNYGNGFF